MLKQEVEELTESLRDDKVFDNVRACLENQNLTANDVLLAGWIENEYRWQAGAIVFIDSGQVYLFEINDYLSSTTFDKWNKVRSITSAITKFPAVEVAVTMCSR